MNTAQETKDMVRAKYAEIALQLAMVRKVLSQLLWEQQRGENLDAASVKTGNPLLTDEQEGRASK